MLLRVSEPSRMMRVGPARGAVLMFTPVGGTEMRAATMMSGPVSPPSVKSGLSTYISVMAGGAGSRPSVDAASDADGRSER
jgi:hypothetical protein